MYYLLVVVASLLMFWCGLSENKSLVHILVAYGAGILIGIAIMLIAN